MVIKCSYHLGEGNPRKEKKRVVDERRYVPYTTKMPNKERARMADRERTNCWKFNVLKKALLENSKLADKLRFPEISNRHSSLERVNG